MVADTRRVAATPYWSGSPVTIGYRDAPRADPAPARVPRDLSATLETEADATLENEATGSCF